MADYVETTLKSYNNSGYEWSYCKYRIYKGDVATTNHDWHLKIRLHAQSGCQSGYSRHSTYTRVYLEKADSTWELKGTAYSADGTSENIYTTVDLQPYNHTDTYTGRIKLTWEISGQGSGSKILAVSNYQKYLWTQMRYGESNCTITSSAVTAAVNTFASTRTFDSSNTIVYFGETVQHTITYPTGYTGDATVSSTYEGYVTYRGTAIDYTLSATIPNHTTVTFAVNGATVTVPTTVHYLDEVTFTAVDDVGYESSCDHISPYTISTQDECFVFTVEPKGTVSIYNNGWQKGLIWLYDGGWKQGMAYVYNNGWNLGV